MHVLCCAGDCQKLRFTLEAMDHSDPFTRADTMQPEMRKIIKYVACVSDFCFVGICA
jgi:hypothetical protein